MKEAEIDFDTVEDLLLQGGYPRLYDRDILPVDFFPSYTETYIQRDVRLIKNIPDLDTFVRFMGLCAGRCGQLLNYQSLANDTGISPNTAKSWISILQASYVIFLLQPFYKNFNKRIIKSPKLYFYDTGLVCSLLRLHKKEDVENYHNKGALFENHVIIELIKAQYNAGLPVNAWFWQDQSGKEIDLLTQSGSDIHAIEIKSGKTFNPSFFQNLAYWQKISGTVAAHCTTVYGGDTSFKTSAGHLLSWKEWIGEENS
jgi:predicted AAA+ superfamily ATPase